MSVICFHCLITRVCCSNVSRTLELTPPGDAQPTLVVWSGWLDASAASLGTWHHRSQVWA